MFIFRAAGGILKTPSVFGFHGIYRQLARNLRIEQDGGLGERGFELLSIWAKEQGLDGFWGTKPGKGRQIKERLSEALQDGLDAGSVARGGGWSCWSFFGDHVAPYEFGRRGGPLSGQSITSRSKGLSRVKFCTSWFLNAARKSGASVHRSGIFMLPF